MPWKNPEKTREAIRKWKARNKERIARTNAASYQRRKALQPPKEPKKKKFKLPKEKVSRKRFTDREKKLRKAICDRRYRLKQGEKLRKKKQEYYKRNRQKISAKCSLDLKTNINKRLAHNFRNRVGAALRRGYKTGSAIFDLGCLIEEFKEYIAVQFTSEMNWENYGSVWHLDHIIPLCRFNLENREDFLKAAHFSNYQPLLVRDNLVKNRYDV